MSKKYVKIYHEIAWSSGPIAAKGYMFNGKPIGYWEEYLTSGLFYKKTYHIQ